MAIFKCKMCGGDLDVKEGETVVECEYCGTKQTVPTSKDEEIRTLFNRANLLRRKCEFDKAEALYEKILLNDEKQAEAYWGVLLCKYGIEYVEDPKTAKRIPTCHRTSFEAITSDEYYKSALQNADPVQRSIYKEEAKYIDGVQKEILSLSEKENPFDVFLCYKETDDNGKRTEDSAIANDIYYQLTQEGYKVFYAAITLENKLGSAYEPVIFAALNSAKVMLAIGTKPEHFNAVWVKNEWSRYLKLMKTDKTKQLIPCYRGMDAYELPEEFAHLQAQDMSKIGFINDLVRGIKKVIGKEVTKKENTPVGAVATANVKPLLQRMNLFLEDWEWERATEYAEKVLDNDPECAEAYLGELLAELQIATIEDLPNQKEEIEDLPLFDKAYRFADIDLKAKLDTAIAENEKFIENLRADKVYAEASQKERTGSREADFLEAAELFESISTFKDSAERVKVCREKAKLAEQQRKERIYQEACTNLKSEDLEKVLIASETFKSIRGFQDSNEKLTECESKIEKLRLAKKEAVYAEACKALSSEVPATILKARKDFEVLGDFKDSKQKIVDCDARIAELKQIADEKARQDAIIAAKQKKKRIVIGVVSGIIALLVLIAISVTSAVTNHNEKVARAGLTYTLSDDGSYYIVSGIDSDMSMDDYVIPASYHDLPVKEILSIAFKGSAVKSVTIPDSVTTIGTSAFSGCKELANITIGTGVTKINDELFKGSAIKSVTIPDSVTTIGISAFSGCKELTNITIGTGVTEINDKAFEDCNYLANVNISDLVAWCKIDFASYSSNPLYYAKHFSVNGAELKSLSIPAGVTEIKKYAFRGCVGVTSVSIPNSLTKIGEYAFYGCTGLTSVSIPNSLTTIGRSAFCGCDNLTSVTISENVKSIGGNAFSFCDNLKTVTWNAKNCVLEGGSAFNSIFDGSSLTSVKIGNEVEQLPDYFLYSCRNVTSISIPDSVTSIGKNAFSNCDGLVNVTIGKGVTTLSYEMFYNSNALTVIVIPDNVTTIQKRAFYGCDSLASVTIGRGVTTIGDETFRLCSKLTHAHFKDPVGWKTTYHVFTSAELSNSVTAATYLTDEYDYDEWRKG